MTILALLVGFLMVVVFLVGGAFTPAGLVLLAFAGVGALIVRRAKRKRGSAAQL